MTSSHHGLYALGHTRATMVGIKGCQAVRRSQSQKANLSSDRGLQFAPVKLESLVITDQPRRGEYVPEPCTHRPSSHPSTGYLKLATSTPTQVGEKVTQGKMCEEG